MTAWHLLPLMFGLCVAGAYLSYTPGRDHPLAPLAFAGLAAGCGVVWGYAVRLLPDSERVYTFSLAWDSVMLFTYYIVPLVALGVRPAPHVLCGTLLVVAGVLVAHR